MTPRKPPTRGGTSYAVMIYSALKSYGGEATYKEITDYISANYKEEVNERRTWRNSVGGVLSSNPAFDSGTI
jgi:hypothetical protein